MNIGRKIKTTNTGMMIAQGLVGVEATIIAEFDNEPKFQAKLENGKRFFVESSDFVFLDQQKNFPIEELKKLVCDWSQLDIERTTAWDFLEWCEKQ